MANSRLQARDLARRKAKSCTGTGPAPAAAAAAVRWRDGAGLRGGQVRRHDGWREL